MSKSGLMLNHVETIQWFHDYNVETSQWFHGHIVENKYYKD